MKRIAVNTLLLFAGICAAAAPRALVDIRDFGAVGDGRTINTQSINAAIKDCSDKGGGIVAVPEGVFVSGTVQLRSNVTLHLAPKAVLKGSDSPADYTSFIPSKDLSRYDSGEGGDNANSSKDANWNKVLLLAAGISNFAIEGEGTIDGSHVFDPNGEEKMRGPHTIIIGESRNFSLSDINIECASNYAVMCYEIENAVFSNLDISQGWDGIHIRGGEHVQIRNCSFRTGDDAIAGGFWHDMVISDCDINTSCNGIRMIMPCDGLTVSGCRFHGPGEYPHRTSGALRRTNMLSAILLQPGGWGKAPGDVRNVTISDITVDNVNNPLMFILNEGNNGRDSRVERLKATRVNRYASSIESWKGGEFANVSFKDIDIEYAGNADRSLADMPISQPDVDARELPCWGWYVNNVLDVTFENITLSCAADGDIRPVFIFDNVASAVFDNVKYPVKAGVEPIRYIRSAKVTVNNTAL